MQLLKLHKYLHWADKKLHSVFFIENKDDIVEDLLADFNEGESTTKTGLVKSIPTLNNKTSYKGDKSS
jgi:hypothetical protein